MQLPRESLLLHIFIGECDRYNAHPLYEAIVGSRTLCARRRGGMAACVVRHRITNQPKFVGARTASHGLRFTLS